MRDHGGLCKGAIGEGSTEPRAVLAVKCGEGKNVASRLQVFEHVGRE